jgi:hypothetical protein
MCFFLLHLKQNPLSLGIIVTLIFYPSFKPFEMKVSIKHLYFIVLTLFLCACTTQTPDNSSTISTVQTQQTLTFQIISAPKNTFGYAIFIDGKEFIHQDNVPAVGGIEGFKTAAQAEKVAQFVIEKMRKNAGLPVVTSDELAQLGAL